MSPEPRPAAPPPRRLRVLHVSPHPDDEVLGAPATLMAMRDAGARVVNLCCSLGSRALEARRREAELVEACRRAGFEHRLAGGLGDVAATLRGEAFDLVVSPSPQDRHPAHERVGRAVLAVLDDGAGPGRWWLWSLWGELGLPTTVVRFGQDRLAEIAHALEAHAGQLARNDFRRLLAGRAQATAVLAGELLFGFGAPGLSGPYAELTAEVVRSSGGAWRLGTSRELDPDAPFPPPSAHEVGWWLREASAAARLRGDR